MWRGFMREVTTAWPVRDFIRPPGIVEADVDAWSGGTPTQFTRETVREVFIDGTVPGPDYNQGRSAGGAQSARCRPTIPTPYVLWVEGCAGIPETRGFLALESVEPGHPDWQAANLDWINRAKQGPGTAGGPIPRPRPRRRTSSAGTTRRTASRGARRSHRPPSCLGMPSPLAVAERIAEHLAAASRSRRRRRSRPNRRRSRPTSPTATADPRADAAAGHHPTPRPDRPAPTTASARHACSGPSAARARRSWRRRRLRRARRRATT